MYNYTCMHSNSVSPIELGVCQPLTLTTDIEEPGSGASGNGGPPQGKSVSYPPKCTLNRVFLPLNQVYVDLSQGTEPILEVNQFHTHRSLC